MSSLRWRIPPCRSEVRRPNFSLDKSGLLWYKTGTLKQSGLIGARVTTGQAAVSSAVAAATAIRIIPAAITNQTSRATGRLPLRAPAGVYQCGTDVTAMLMGVKSGADRGDTAHLSPKRPMSPRRVALAAGGL